MNFFASLKKKVVTLLGPVDPNRIVFEAELQRKLAQLNTLLQTRAGQNLDQKRMKEASALLTELLKPLQALSWDYPDARASLWARGQLVQLADSVLHLLDNLLPAERFNMFKAEGYALRRLEHGGAFLTAQLLDAHFNPSAEELAICLRYRALLFAVLRHTAHTLSSRPELPPEETPAANPLPAGDDAMEGLPGTANGTDAAAPLRTPTSSASSMLVQTPAMAYAYCAQVLAVLAFRLPDLCIHIVRNCIVVTEEDLKDLHDDMRECADQIFQEQQEQHKRQQEEHQQQQQQHDDGRREFLSATSDESRKLRLSFVGGGDHRGLGHDIPKLRYDDHHASYYLQMFEEESPVGLPDALVEKLPALFAWDNFHVQLSTLDSSKRTVQGLFNEFGTDWLEGTLRRDQPLFQFFFRYWLEHVQLVQEASGVSPRVSFRDIPPYRSLVRAFLIHFAEGTDRTRALIDCATALIAVEPQLISFFFKTLFMSTNAQDVSALLDTLSQCDAWLKQISNDGGSLGPDFDYDFVCCGFDRILQMEHHVVTARLLTLIFNYAHLFVGDGRVALFANLLISKYGPQLFLCWDSNTRSIFHQILVFRLLRQTRRSLQSQPPNPAPKTFDQDRILLTKQEALVRMVKRQVEEKDAEKKKEYDAHLEGLCSSRHGGVQHLDGKVQRES